MVRAKFMCVSKKEIPDGFVIELQPVTSGSPENEQYFKYTPYGKIEVGTINKAAAADFVVGKPYYVDFTQAGVGVQDTKEAV